MTIIPRQDRVVVAPDAGCRELIQDILGLMEGHQTHTKQGEAETHTETDITSVWQYVTLLVHMQQLENSDLL